MTTADYFYPGFEHAGIETPAERALTCTMCMGVLIGTAILDTARRFSPKAKPRTFAYAYDG